MSKITWFGHSAFRIESAGCTVMLDPFFAPGSGFSWQDAGKIDLVLVTHDHGDHVGSAVEICRHWGAALGCMVGTAQALMDRGVPAAQVLNGIGFNIGGTLVFKNVAVTMTQAFHSSETGAPAGFILTLPDGPVLYHAGDTGIFSSMQLLGSLYGVELALLPIGGVFTMDGRQAAKACQLLGCKSVIPMHYGTFPALAQSPAEFERELAQCAPQCRCLTMTPGETIALPIQK